MIKIITIVGLFLTITHFGKAQVKVRDMIGLWTTCNDDSLYFKSDTITMHQNINHRSMQKKPCCYNVNWNIKSKRKFKIENLYACTEPGRIRTHEGKERFKISKGNKQEITIKRAGRIIERFRVIEFEEQEIDRYPYTIKFLKLIRL